jgi:hypothetical protein
MSYVKKNKNIIAVLTIALAIFLASCNDQRNEQQGIKPDQDNIFSSLDYDKVVAYSYDGEGDIEIIDEKGSLAKKIEKQIELNKSQIIRLTNVLCDKSTYGGDIAACFNPHLGVVFYRTNKPAAWVSICLDCNYLVSSIKIPLGESGFSADGVKKIIAFENEVNF